KRARFETDHWQLEEVTTTLLHPREKRSEVVKLPTERWDAQLSPQLLNTVVMEPEALSISGLWQYIHYLADQGLNNNRYWLAFWTKVLQPLVTLPLIHI
ncbi:LptF/LptG family permease, partial [Pseudomonas aeruginosa]